MLVYDIHEAYLSRLFYCIRKQDSIVPWLPIVFCASGVLDQSTYCTAVSLLFLSTGVACFRLARPKTAVTLCVYS